MSWSMTAVESSPGGKPVQFDLSRSPRPWPDVGAALTGAGRDIRA